MKITKNMKIQSGLVSNLENEFMLESRVKEVEEKKKDEQKKILFEKENSFKI